MAIRTHIKVLKRGLDTRLIWGLVTLCVLLLCAYAYFLGSSVVNVVVREEVELSIAKLNSNIGDLEFKYLQARDAISASAAQSMGLTSVERTFYSTRPGISVNTAHNNR
ncbi:hypothetical protein COU17_02275 [Candidatus Kaiserbacteria bacterium CG10_big_fil_rev_8_21_14_0_10_49_17]|uniref:Uncharacterized protein n=1 Tax=Candidatus Kaiserbacteria bacterium CG10_big_fil_rev_8_21_14_0_10_49_17 TaxID=1974609 RepID=A0A2M6WE98_9BACT|nr:MAG: hypothetical protein COU17_02275 [Candidatus Kaiserbacteria bacterium CG10_big_fil_rev_8_21_14_0_10_49_17]